MLNDEIDTVRLSSISTLQSIGTKHGIDIKEDQLQIVSSNLEDSSFLIREALHHLLG